MRRLICRLCVFFLVFSLAACGNSGNKSGDADAFQIGFGRVDVTPAEPIHLWGYNDHVTRISKGALHALYVHAIVMKGPDGKLMAMLTSDLCEGSTIILNEIRPLIKEQFGLESDQVVFGGTHNHNAPDYGYNDQYDLQYKDVFKNGCLEAIEQAIDDMAPATAEIGRTATKNMTFVRRYYLSNGQMTGDNHNYDHNSTIVAHETEADEEIQLVRFKREGDHKDIVLVNWQSHAAKHGHTDMISADFPGPLRDKVDKELDVHTVFYQGACGNLNPMSRIPGESLITTGGYEGAVEVGERVADYVIKALNTEGLMKRVETGNVRNTQRKFVGQETYDEANTITCGELSFVTFPAEFYDTLGMQIKTGTPYKMTVLMGFHCGNGQYLPTYEAYLNGGYGPSNSRYVPGEGEKFVQFYLDILNDMYQNENP